MEELKSLWEQLKSLFEDHTHDGVNSKQVLYENIKDTPTINSLLPSQTGNSGKFLTTNGSALSWGSVTSINFPVTGGETLTAGEVVCLKLGTGNNTTQGYQWVNGSVYAIRAAANDTTYGANVLGIMTSATTYLGTGTCTAIGDITGLTGLTAGSKHYLDNYSVASSLTITQTSQDASENSATTLNQIFTPTSSRLDKIIILAARNGGSPVIDVHIKRSNTTIASVTGVAISGTATEYTFDFSDVQVYKGELLNLSVVLTTGFEVVYYKSGGSVYNGSLTGGAVPANSDLYFKVYEYTNFGKLNTTAGTRKFKMGQALSSTELVLNMQEADSLL